MAPVLDVTTSCRVSRMRLERSCRAKKIVARSGIRADVLADLEALGDVDWPCVAAVTSAVFAITGNELAARAFWLTEADELDGLTPAEALLRPGGVDAVAQYAPAWHRNRRRARQRVPQPA